jgi:hypothetical protein
MKIFARIAVVCLISAIGATSAFAQAGGEADSLVKIKAKKVDQAYLLPGTDFSAYKKVMIVPSEVAFQKNWLRDMKNQAMSLSHRITDKDAQKILEAARSGFDEIWAEAFKEAGYEVVTSPGDGVLKLMPGVFDLYINAPDVPTASRSKSYTVEAGEAGLNLEVRDSVSGTLLGRVVDKRTAGTDMGRMQWTTSVSNRSDFNQLFKRWAKLAATGLAELAKASPLPDTLQPNQKLPKK